MTTSAVAKLNGSLLRRRSTGDGESSSFIKSLVQDSSLTAAKEKNQEHAIGSQLPRGRIDKKSLKDSVRLSVRLSTDRHLRVKLTAAHTNKSIQELITEALDSYLDHITPGLMNKKCSCIIEPSSGKNTSCAE